MEDFDKSQGTSADRPQRGWWSRNWRWLVPTALLGSVVLCGGCCLGIFLLAFGVLKSSEPYQMALERVKNDPQVIEQLGEPIEESGWFPTGEVNIQNGSGRAGLYFNVAGPEGKGQVHAEAQRIDGRWSLTLLEITPEGGQRIPLDNSADDGPDEAPLFEP
jgi:hypothetical protein